MRGSLRKYFEQHPAFQLNSGVFMQQLPPSGFEEHYLPLRSAEGRLFDDQTLAKLPILPDQHILSHEWTIRKHSADKLVAHLRKKNPSTILEIGCGNGWLLHYIRQSLNVDAAGVDINQPELLQASRVFGKQDSLILVNGDILSHAFQGALADVIIVASAIQYFNNLPLLINKLLTLLMPSGEIHILDSPLYHKQTVGRASLRSTAYFSKTGSSGMANFYFHHTWESLRDFHFQVLYDPMTLQNKIKRKLGSASPFPWIRISAP
jgi:ubiquinone/menaquinone biosynthesis C-methylase UbiE